MSKKLDKFYFDGKGNFRALLHDISLFHAPKENVWYDPTKAKIVVYHGDETYSEFDVGSPDFENDPILKQLEENWKKLQP